MSYERHIPWFNPREMDDATVRALSTGRDALLEDFFKAVRQRLSHPGPGSHWLVTGPRGAGKSYFLRLVQANFLQELGDTARFVLLPEEHSNIFSPHELLQEIKRMLFVEQGHIGTSSAWRVKDEEAAWTQALRELLDAWSGPLLVIGVENFDQLMQQAFGNDVSSARLRTLLAHEPRLMLLATAVQGDFDEDYQNRFFRQFEHRDMPNWDDEAHRCYLQRRAELQGKKPTPHQLARIEAYSRYTGGNARVAAVLAGAILDEQDPLLACADLSATLDRMTEYYRALLERIPPNTRKLFDALIRGGEPSSQTEIAERIGARQSDISRAFAWLIDYGYVRDERETGRKERRYLVADRLFVQFYRMRYLQPGQRTQLSLLADLLADTIEFADKWRYAERYFNDGYENEARTMAELACHERSINVSLLAPEARNTARLIKMGLGWEVRDAIVEAGDGGNTLQAFEEIFRRFSDDNSMRQAYEEARDLAQAASRGDVQGALLIPLLDGSLSLCPAEKYHILTHLLNPKTDESQWRELIDLAKEDVRWFEKLETTECNVNDALKNGFELGRQYPLAHSLQDLANNGSAIFENGFGPDVAARWAAKAAVLWSLHQHKEEVTVSLETCFHAIAELMSKSFRPELILEVLVSIEVLAETLSAEQRARLYGYKGSTLGKLQRFYEALDAYGAARQNWLQAKELRAAAWSLARMSWCQGALGQFASAIDGHGQARTESLALNRPENAAWNLGQLARHTIRQTSLEAAWAMLDKFEPDHQDYRIKAWQQLGDAVWDCARQEGEVKAFALGCKILEGLASRPQYPAEEALRALWIDMIDMDVPHVILRDLLGEVLRIFADNHDGVKMLCAILSAWLDDLDCPPPDRTSRRKTLDPDLATTLEALGQNLSAATKARLKLDG